MTSLERRRIRSIAKQRHKRPHPRHLTIISKLTRPRYPTKRRRKRALTSIQKKYWWPFNRNKEIVITKSLSTKHKKPHAHTHSPEGWSSCEHHCSCDHGKCHHHHHDDRGHGHGHHSGSDGPGISYVHHIHHNQQQQLLGNLGLDGSGRSHLPPPVRHKPPPPPPPPPEQGPKFSSAEEIAHEKREVSLIQEKIRLKEEIHRLRDDRRREEGIKEIHHHHGPTHVHGRRRRRRPPPHHRDRPHPHRHHPEDNSSSEEDEDELDKKLKIVEAEKKTAKVQLLASLLSQMGVGGKVTDLLHHGLSRIPNSFDVGTRFGPYLSVGSSGGGFYPGGGGGGHGGGRPHNGGGGGGGGRPGGGNRDSPASPSSGNSGGSSNSGSGPRPVQPPAAGTSPANNSPQTAPANNAPAAAPVNSAPAAAPVMTPANAGMMGANAGMMGANTGMMGANAGMMGANAGMMAMNTAGMAGMMVAAPAAMYPVRPVAPAPAPVPAPVPVAPIANPAVQLAAQILLEEALEDQVSDKSEESGSDEAENNDITPPFPSTPPAFASDSEEEEEEIRRPNYRHSPPELSNTSVQSKPNHPTPLNRYQEEDDDDEKENFSDLGGADDSVEELLDGLR